LPYTKVFIAFVQKCTFYEPRNTSGTVTPGRMNKRAETGRIIDEDTDIPEGPQDVMAGHPA
jgi:hypothetical protein